MNRTNQQDYTLKQIEYDLIQKLPSNTSPTEEEQRRIRSRAQHIHTILKEKYDWFITLTFQFKQHDHDKVVEKTKRFFDVISSKVYGSRSKKRVVHFSVIDRHAEGSLHVHFLLQKPSTTTRTQEEIQQFIHGTWKHIASTDLDISASSDEDGNKEWFKPIKENTLYALAHYITKDCYRYNDAVIYGPKHGWKVWA